MNDTTNAAQPITRTLIAASDATSAATQASARTALLTALAAARAATGATVLKAGQKTGAGGQYSYVGHEHVVVHVRKAMLEQGLMLLQTQTTWMGLQPQGQGKADLNQWRGSFVLVHTQGGELEFSYECFTSTGDKSAFNASTSLDRTALLRIMGIAGSDDEDPEHNSNHREEPAAARPNVQQRVAEKREAKSGQAISDEREVAHHTGHLPSLSAVDQLVEWAAWLKAAPFDRETKKPAWNAFGQRCLAVGLNPDDLTHAFNTKAKAILAERQGQS